MDEAADGGRVEVSEFDIRMEEEDLARFVGSRHVGMAGEKMEFPGLKVFMSVEKETDFGVVTVLGFEDGAGNVLVWFASGQKAYRKGDAVNLKAVVKGYDESEGVRKTVITRAREFEVKEGWRPCVVGTTRRR